MFSAFRRNMRSMSLNLDSSQFGHPNWASSVRRASSTQLCAGWVQVMGFLRLKK